MRSANRATLLSALLVLACTGEPVGEATTDGGAGAAGGGGQAGSDAGADGLRVLAEGRDCPADLRVAAGSVTWVDQGSLQNSATDGVVATLPATGCSDDAGGCIVELAKDQLSPAAVEVRAGTVYWTTFSNDSIWVLAPQGSAPTLFAGAQNGPRWLAADDTALYWTNAGQLAAADGDVHRAWLDEPGSGGLAIVSQLDSPVALTVAGATVFFTEYGLNDTDGRVVRADVTGSGRQVIAQNQSQPRGIAANAAYVYWANAGDGTIMRATLAGNEVTQLVSGLSTPSDVAVDGKGLYWVEAGTPSVFSDGSVKAAALDGTGVVTLAEAQRDPRRVVLDVDHVYWINRGTQGISACTQHDGQVVRAPKPW